MTVTWSFPTTIVFGSGTAATLGEQAVRVGGSRALLVVDSGVVSAGVAERVRGVLEAASVATALFDGIGPSLREKDVLEGAEAFRSHRADVVVAVGGAASLDAGKLVALKATHELPLEAYERTGPGAAAITPAVPPIVAAPTTAGSGSEVTPSCGVTTESARRKVLIESPRLLPKAAILDPELTVSASPRVTGATGFHALTHAIEAYLATGDDPLADAAALMAIELAAKHLPRAIEAPLDIVARGGLLKAAMLGAVAMKKGRGVCHSLAHPLSGMPHGLANALCLPAVVDFNNAAVPDRVERIRRLVDLSATSLSNALRSLRDRVGLPTGLAAEGVTKRDIPKLVELATNDASHRSNPRPCTREDMAKLYELSL